MKNTPHNKSLPPNVSYKGGAYYYHPSVKVNGKWKKVWTKLHVDYEPAMHEWARVTGRATTSKRCNSVFDRYMLEIAPQKGRQTYKGNLQEIKHLRLFFGNMNIDQIYTTDIYEYLDTRCNPKTKKKSPVRANREIALLSGIFTKAIRWGLVKENPCEGAERNTEKPRERYIEDAEFTAVRNMAPPLIAAMMGVAYATGRREGELLRINKRTDITDDGIIIRDNKGKQSLLLVWNDALRKAYNEAVAVSRRIGSLYLFANQKGQPYTSSGFYTMFSRTVKKAIEKGLIKSSFTFHDIRAKRSSDAPNDQSACDLLAHSSVAITRRHYRRKLRRVELG